ncbi:hypothetical protein IGI57_000076 [Enterococcus sp. DIV0213j]|jgi:hypothetical protein|nr:hypothetical protein D920_00469 [Enterococcus faecalis 13-SD-W-01]
MPINKSSLEQRLFWMNKIIKQKFADSCVVWAYILKSEKNVLTGLN